MDGPFFARLPTEFRTGDDYFRADRMRLRQASREIILVCSEFSIDC